MHNIVKIVKLITFLIGGFIITMLAIRIPLDGPRVFGNLSCGYPSGLPFSFIGTWKYWPEGFPILGCALDFDLVALMLDIAFWAFLLYMSFNIIRKIILRFEKI